jgi:hypothetical protein
VCYQVQRRLYVLGRGLQRENRRKRSKKLGRGGGRKSKDKVENAEGKRLMKWITMEKKQGDEELERINIGSGGETVIDYGIVSEEAWERVEEFRIGERVESGLLPLEISIRNEP